MLTSPGCPILASMTPTMKSSVVSFLQAAVVLIGIGALAFMLWEPHLEGRNAHATVFEIYFKDPFLAYVYVGSIPFFVALYRVYVLFGHLRRNRVYSQVTVDGMGAIKRCGITLIGFVLGGVVIIAFVGDKEDRPVGFVMGFLVIVASSVVAAAAATFARRLRRALERSAGCQE